jgi:hypothetical protein
MYPPFDLSAVTDHMAQALEATEQELRLEQAVYGLDFKSETQLQEILAQRLADHYEIAREVCYPSTRGARRAARQRCDLVLTPRGRPLRLDSAEPSLFDPADRCQPSEALWLEVKVAYQYREGGVRHGGYGNQWRSAIIDDLRKMEADPLIRQAALALVVFNESPEILQKDLEHFELVLAQQEVLAGFRQVRSIPIVNRIGHTLCTVALWPTLQRQPSDPL